MWMYQIVRAESAQLNNMSELEEKQKELEEVIRVFNTVLDIVSGTPLELEDCMDEDEWAVIERIRQ